MLTLDKVSRMAGENKSLKIDIHCSGGGFEYMDPFKVSLSNLEFK